MEFPSLHGKKIEEILDFLSLNELSESQAISLISDLLKDHEEREVMEVFSKLSVSSMSSAFLQQVFSMFSSPFLKTASLLLSSERKSYEELKEDNKKLSDVVMKMHDPKTSLFKAAKEGIFILAKSSIEKDKTIVNSVDSNQYTPIMYACEEGHDNIVSLLIDNGADIEAKGIYETRPLHRACANGRTSICSTLMQAGADIEAPDEDGERPIHYAVSRNNIETVNLLIANRCDVNARNARILFISFKLIKKHHLRKQKEAKHTSASKYLLSKMLRSKNNSSIKTFVFDTV